MSRNDSFRAAAGGGAPKAWRGTSPQPGPILTIPPLQHLYVYLTGGCNLACRHCWIDPVHQPPGAPGPELDLDLLNAILDQAKDLGLSGVKLTGGEPLLHS